MQIFLQNMNILLMQIQATVKNSCPSPKVIKYHSIDTAQRLKSEKRPKKAINRESFVVKSLEVSHRIRFVADCFLAFLTRIKQRNIISNMLKLTKSSKSGEESQNNEKRRKSQFPILLFPLASSSSKVPPATPSPLEVL